MLSNKEYAAFYRVPEELPAEFEPFAAFTIEMPSGHDLWHVGPAPTMSVAKMRKIQAREAEKDRQARLELYVKRGFAFDERASTNPSGGVDED